MAVQKYSKAKAAANERWNEKHKDRMAYLNFRSAAKSFILKKATSEDLTTMMNYIHQRQRKLKK